MLDVLWVSLLGLAVVFGVINGRTAEVAQSATEGAAAAVTLCIGLAGAMILWTGIASVMKASGLEKKIAAVIMPLLRPLFPVSGRDAGAREAISASVCANLLGLGNASTPLGLRAAQEIERATGSGETASDELCRLVVLNSSSIQLVPITAASVRAALGSATPFDIIPAVLLCSVCSLAVGMTLSFLLAGHRRRKA